MIGKFKSILDKLKGKNAEIVIAIVVCLIVVILFAGKLDFTARDSDASGDDLYTYGHQLQTQIEDVLSKIEGVGRVSVAVTFCSGEQSVYAYETVSENIAGRSSTTERIVTAGGSPLIVGTIAPQIQGVLVVIEGGDNAIVRFNCVNALKVLLGIEEDKIQINTYGRH